MLARLRRRLAGDDGISLVEMIVAIGLVAVVLLALMSSTITALAAIRGNERQVRATALVNEILENLQALDFERAGLYDAEVASHFGPTTTEFEGEDLVILPDEATRDALIPYPAGLAAGGAAVNPVKRDGVAYDVETVITWVDEASDGVGPADADGPKDIKRFVAMVTWQHNGGPRTLRTEALRAPTPDDKRLTTVIEPDRIPITDPPDGRNVNAFTVRAFTRERASSVTLRFPLRGGGTFTVGMAPSADRRTWTYTVNAGAHQFANGEALFNFTAVEVDGDTVTATDRALFLHDLELDDEDIVVSRDPLAVVLAPRRSCPFTLTVEVQGAVTSDSVRAKWFPAPSDERAVPVLEPTTSGARFRLAYDNPDDPFEPGEATLRVTIVRGADGSTLVVEEDFEIEEAASCSLSL
ncbi:MAG: type II secretion system GspH family protein [Actinomycetota bacterium]|nr:type II secretion system GspH family protein [Actinomycetota bacterium]